MPRHGAGWILSQKLSLEFGKFHLAEGIAYIKVKRFR